MQINLIITTGLINNKRLSSTTSTTTSTTTTTITSTTSAISTTSSTSTTTSAVTKTSTSTTTSTTTTTIKIGCQQLATDQVQYGSHNLPGGVNGLFEAYGSDGVVDHFEV